MERRTSPQTAVVFYSLEGNVRHLAQSIVRVTGAQSIELVPLEAGRDTEMTEYVWGDTRIVCPVRPEIEALAHDFSSYDLVFLGSPVWKGGVAPPILSFLDSHDFFKQRFALFCSYSGRSGAFFDSARQLLLGCDVVGTIGFREPLRFGPSRAAQQIADWALKMLKSR